MFRQPVLWLLHSYIYYASSSGVSTVEQAAPKKSHPIILGFPNRYLMISQKLLSTAVWQQPCLLHQLWAPSENCPSSVSAHHCQLITTPVILPILRAESTKGSALLMIPKSQVLLPDNDVNRTLQNRQKVPEYILSQLIFLIKEKPGWNTKIWRFEFPPN